jgi:hypothetical protein
VSRRIGAPLNLALPASEPDGDGASTRLADRADAATENGRTRRPRRMPMSSPPVARTQLLEPIRAWLARRRPTAAP